MQLTNIPEANTKLDVRPTARAGAQAAAGAVPSPRRGHQLQMQLLTLRDREAHVRQREVRARRAVRPCPGCSCTCCSLGAAFDLPLLRGGLVGAACGRAIRGQGGRRGALAQLKDVRRNGRE